MYGETSSTEYGNIPKSGLSPHVRGNPLICTWTVAAGGSIPACTGKPSPAQASVCAYRVYPRMYGETATADHCGGWLEGLSPHVRGNPPCRHTSLSCQRSIPACTGKPRRPSMIEVLAEVYPRMYGETAEETKKGTLWQGLSPHVRGNRSDATLHRGVQRSIPACTGKPARNPHRMIRRAVYPRMYGETEVDAGESIDLWGLSPHVRGNPCSFQIRHRYRGSIPACTGKPAIPDPPLRTSRVYPRMYGETCARMDVTSPISGLSPHVRGNHLVPPYRRLILRSIPACTGKPLAGNTGLRGGWVYPRMYGETAHPSQAAPVPLGLSPHVRGNRHTAERPRRADGSIPACTGKPAACRTPSTPTTVYPRMYGETARCVTALRRTDGLSPHVRGNLVVVHRRHSPQRSIPACTGKPFRRGDRAMTVEVYPRMYGETCLFLCYLWAGWGLSPHVRGNPVVGYREPVHHGSIPACTGKPTLQTAVHDVQVVYPRMYGETLQPLVSAGCRRGLSPHVRGNLSNTVRAEPL